MNYTAFLEWTRNKPFPREVQLSRVIVKDSVELQKQYTPQDFYSAIFNSAQIFYEEFDTIFFDIDGKKGGTDESYDKLVKFLNRVDYGVSRVYFSGVGFHVFIDLNKPITGKEEYRQFCRTFTDNYNLTDLIDHSALADTRRVARVPYTLNSKSSRMAIQINPHNTMEEVLANSKEGKAYVPPKKLTFHFDFQKTSSPPPKPAKVSEIEWAGIYPPCITTAENLLYNVGELGHTSRVHLATFLLQTGKEEELRKYLKKANDYKPDITEYQLNNLTSGNYMPLKCVNVTDEICGYSKNKSECPFFPYVFKNFMRRE